MIQLFLPRTGAGARGGAARRLVATTLRSAGLAVIDWRTVPTDPDALGGAARACRPAFVQVFVHRPPDAATGRPSSDAAFERRLVVARRRLESAARDAGLGDVIAVPSASCRTIVYKGLVAGARLADLYPDLRDTAIRVPYALFHQRYATNTQPTWRLAQPFRTIAHNGEINTVRGNRAQVHGRVGDVGGGTTPGVAAELAAAGPLLAADGSDSQSLDEMLELLVSTGWDLGTALLTAMPEALGLRRAPHPHVAALRRRTAGFLAPWDGPAAIVFGDGRRVGAIADRNGLRPTAFAVTRDRLVAVASEAGAIPLRARRDRPPRPSGTRRAAARRAGPRPDPRRRRGEDAAPPPAADPRCAPADPRGSCAW